MWSPSNKSEFTEAYALINFMPNCFSFSFKGHALTILVKKIRPALKRLFCCYEAVSSTFDSCDRPSLREKIEELLRRCIRFLTIN